MDSQQTDLLKTPAPQASTVPEKDFAAHLGVEREVLKKLRVRELLPEEDWYVGAPNASILLTESGQKKIRAALGLPETEPPRPPKKKNGAVTLVVYRITRNPHIIEMRTLEDKPARLRVRKATNFIPRMQVPDCFLIQADLYEYRGKLPRRRGRII